MKYLALDIGTRRTGVAFADDANGIPLPLDTIKHASVDELIPAVVEIVRARDVQEVVVGHPLLLSGEVGSQAAFVESVAEKLRTQGMNVTLFDERFSTPQFAVPDQAQKTPASDPDSAAACQILLTILQRKGI